MRKFCFLVIIIFQFACEKNEKDRFSYTGDFLGHIVGDSLHWYNGTHYPDAVQVIFDRGDQIYKTTCDSLGKFEFRNIPYGTYNITLLKENYVPTYNPGYQLYFTHSKHEDWFYIFKKNRIQNIRTELFSIDGLDFHQVICDGVFGENERVELIIFLNENEVVDYNNYTSFKYMSYNYCESCFNVLFTGTDSLSTNAYYAIYPVAGFNHEYANWHLINDLRDYPIVFNKEVSFKGYYDKNSSHAR